MGFTIECPHCGPRPYTEFWYDGEVSALLPGEASTAEEEFDRVWTRQNADGAQDELWFHIMGCRRWLAARRDTTTNELHAD